MGDRTVFRLRDIVDSVDKIDSLLSDKSFDQIFRDNVSRAAFERFLEILSEASRHVPAELKADEPAIPWRQVADIGNYLRHAYHRVDVEVLWNIWANGQLTALRGAVERMIAKLSG